MIMSKAQASFLGSFNQQPVPQEYNQTQVGLQKQLVVSHLSKQSRFCLYPIKVKEILSIIKVLHGHTHVTDQKSKRNQLRYVLYIVYEWPCRTVIKYQLYVTSKDLSCYLF